jgi:cytoplasmic iron level regulating protein YaaA (DUF328/UPF0246 family)
LPLPNELSDFHSPSINMLIVLPPSEAKSSPSQGPALSPSSLSFADGLSTPRNDVRKRLVALANGPTKRALKTLGLTPGLADQLELNRALLTAPSACAVDIYSGVLYEALNWKSLSAAAKKRGGSHLLIISALFGALRPVDFIPPYRLSMNVSLPRIGGLSAYWQRHLPQVLDRLESELIVDLRSQTYARVWKPNPTISANVRIFVERSGTRSVVTHMAKQTRGEVARALLSLNKTPTSIDTLAHSLSKHFEVETTKPATLRQPHLLDVILHAR